VVRRGEVWSSARRYARTLLELALAEGAAEPVREALRGAARLLTEQPELRRVLEHPAVSAEKKRAVVERIWVDAPPLLRRLLLLLAARERLNVLPDVERLYTREWNARPSCSVPRRSTTVSTTIVTISKPAIAHE